MIEFNQHRVTFKQWIVKEPCKWKHFSALFVRMLHTDSVKEKWVCNKWFVYFYFYFYLFWFRVHACPVALLLCTTLFDTRKLISDFCACEERIWQTKDGNCEIWHVMWSGLGCFSIWWYIQREENWFFRNNFSFESKMSFVAIQLHNFICGQSVDIGMEERWKNSLIVIWHFDFVQLLPFHANKIISWW